MDIYERLKRNKPKKYQEIMRAISRAGDPEEILAYINAMPICCPEGKGILHMDHEVRVDSRFLVFCYCENIVIYKTEHVRSFYVSAYKNYSSYRFGINSQKEYLIDSRSAYQLYEKLLALCPDFFQSAPGNEPIELKDGPTLFIDDQALRIEESGLFGRVKKTFIPLRDIRSCCQKFDYNEDWDYGYLYLRTHDGKVHEFSAWSNDKCFQIARRIKAVVPELVYEFPVKSE